MINHSLGNNKESELSKQRKEFEKLILEKTNENKSLNQKLQELQKKYDMLSMELNAIRDAHDKNNNEKIKEIEKLK